MKIRVWLYGGRVYKTQDDAVTDWWNGQDPCACDGCVEGIGVDVVFVDLETSDYEIIDGGLPCEKS